MKKLLVLFFVFTFFTSCFVTETMVPDFSRFYDIYIYGGRDLDYTSSVTVKFAKSSPFIDNKYEIKSKCGDGVENYTPVSYEEKNKEMIITLNPSEAHTVVAYVDGEEISSYHENIFLNYKPRNITIHFRLKEPFIKEPTLVGSTYEIRTPEELRWISSGAQRSNTFAGKTIKLMNDIDMDNKSFTGIAVASTNLIFNGQFDGNGYEIKNLNIDIYSYAPVAFIGILGSSGIVENLGISGNIVGRDVAGIVHANYGIVRKVYNKATVKGNGSVYLGAAGVVRGNLGVVENVYNLGRIISGYEDVSSSFIAGVVQANYENAVVRNAYNIGSVVGNNLRKPASVIYYNVKNAQVLNTYYLRDVNIDINAIETNENDISSTVVVNPKTVADFNNNIAFNFDNTIWKFKSGLDSINGITSRYVLIGVGEGK